MLSVVEIPGKGRGVVATEDIAEGAVIETASVQLFDNSQTLPTELSILQFEWDEERDAIVMGKMTFTNHSSNPNCRIEHDFDNSTISLIAERPIKKGQELTFDYGCPLWFEEI